MFQTLAMNMWLDVFMNEIEQRQSVLNYVFQLTLFFLLHTRAIVKH